MHDIIAFLKNAVSREKGGSINGCYIFNNSSIYAQTLGMQAGVSLDSPIEFNVPAKEFDAALSRMKEVQSLTYSGNELTIKSGRLKASIRCITDTPPSIADMPETWLPFPTLAIDAIKIARQFIGDQSWMAGIRLMHDHVTAFSNRFGIDITVPNLKLDPILITDDCAAFLIAQGAPDEFAPSENNIIFRWSNGRWMRAQLMIGNMPDLTQIFTSAGADAPIEITDEWREAYADAAALSDADISITAKGLRGNAGVSTSDVEAAINLAEDHVSHWAVKTLTPIIECATHWNPAAYPKPSLFIGPNIKGVVIGVKK